MVQLLQGLCEQRCFKIARGTPPQGKAEGWRSEAYASWVGTRDLRLSCVEVDALRLKSVRFIKCIFSHFLFPFCFFKQHPDCSKIRMHIDKNFCLVHISSAKPQYCQTLYTSSNQLFETSKFEYLSHSQGTTSSFSLK